MITAVTTEFKPLATSLGFFGPLLAVLQRLKIWQAVRRFSGFWTWDE